MPGQGTAAAAFNPYSGAVDYSAESNPPAANYRQPTFGEPTVILYPPGYSSGTRTEVPAAYVNPYLGGQPVFNPPGPPQWIQPPPQAPATGSYGVPLQPFSMDASPSQSGVLQNLYGAPPVLVSPPAPSLAGNPAAPDWPANARGWTPEEVANARELAMIAQQQTARAFQGMYGYGPGTALNPSVGGEFAQISNIPAGAFGSIGPSNAFGGRPRGWLL